MSSGTAASDQLAIGLWTQAQAQSAAFSERTDIRYQRELDLTGGVYQPGQGSIGPGTFFTNGNPPT
jgi:hypothetical protein